jgi:hypothetical protein
MSSSSGERIGPSSGPPSSGSVSPGPSTIPLLCCGRVKTYLRVGPPSDTRSSMAVAGRSIKMRNRMRFPATG